MTTREHKPVDEKIKRSIKQRVGRAIASYRREEHWQVTYHVFFFDDGLISVSTECAGGDNVCWATEPMGRIIRALADIAKPTGDRTHCCGGVSRYFTLV